MTNENVKLAIKLLREKFEEILPRYVRSEVAQIRMRMELFGD